VRVSIIAKYDNNGCWRALERNSGWWLMHEGWGDDDVWQGQASVQEVWKEAHLGEAVVREVWNS